MNSSCHVGELELSVLEGANWLAKLMSALHIVQCHICAELSTANTAAEGQHVRQQSAYYPRKLLALAHNKQ